MAFKKTAIEKFPKPFISKMVLLQILISLVVRTFQFCFACLFTLLYVLFTLAFLAISGCVLLVCMVSKFLLLAVIKLVRFGIWLLMNLVLEFLQVVFAMDFGDERV